MNVKPVFKSITQNGFETVRPLKFKTNNARKLVLPQMENFSADYVIMDTFKDKNGIIKARAVTFINTEEPVNLEDGINELV